MKPDNHTTPAMPQPDSSFDPHRRLRRRLWVAMGIVTVLVLAGKAALDLRYQRAATAHMALAAKMELERKARYAGVVSVAQEMVRLRKTPAEFEAALGCGKPTQVLNIGTSLIYVDPKTNIEITLLVDPQGRIKGWCPNTVPLPSPQRYAVEKWIGQLGAWLCPVVFGFFSPIFGFFTPIAGFPWLLIAVWGFCFPRHGREAAQALIGWSLFCSLIWVAAPNCPLTPSGIMSNDRLFWGALMMGGAILVAWRLWARAPREWWRCVACGYNLTGLTSDSCPECGARVSDATKQRLQEQWSQSQGVRPKPMGDPADR
jgi:hypothetical protein